MNNFKSLVWNAGCVSIKTCVWIPGSHIWNQVSEHEPVTPEMNWKEKTEGLLGSLPEKPQSHIIPPPTQDDELESSRRGHQSLPVTSTSHVLPVHVYATHTHMCIHTYTYPDYFIKHQCSLTHKERFNLLHLSFTVNLPLFWC